MQLPDCVTLCYGECNRATNSVATLGNKKIPGFLKNHPLGFFSVGGVDEIWKSMHTSGEATWLIKN